MEKVNFNRKSWLRGNCIGQGSFGTVSLAVDKSDGNLFAVKSVEQTSYSSPHMEALENEIRILKSLSSPYVVDYFGDDVSTETATTSYRNLHMEYMPGGTAADLAKCPGADEDEGIIRSITSCVVSALRYVHSLGIVHCDVKGRNVLVGSTPGAAKLADFGSAVEFTEDMRPRGSPLWMAPEVVRGEYQGPESDVWSLACTVIEMVTGKPAWEDGGVDTLCRIGYSDDLPKLPTQLSELGLDFLSKCLRKDRTERWSCDQLLQHPFLLSFRPSDTVSDSSPRCTLDWFDSNFSDEDDDQQTGDNSVSSTFNGKDRIGKLASKPGAIWEESDAWVAVRTMTSEKEDVTDSGACWGCGQERERSNLEYPYIIEEIMEEYSDSSRSGEVSGRSNWECLDANGGSVLHKELDFNYCINYITPGAESSEAGSSRPYGSQKNYYRYWVDVWID